MLYSCLRTLHRLGTTSPLSFINSWVFPLKPMRFVCNWVSLFCPKLKSFSLGLMIFYQFDEAKWYQSYGAQSCTNWFQSLVWICPLTLCMPITFALIWWWPQVYPMSDFNGRLIKCIFGLPFHLSNPSHPLSRILEL